MIDIHPELCLFQAGRNTRSRSRGGPQKTPPQPRKRNTSEGNALEHENSPAVGGELSQELSLEIEDDATKPVSATGSNVLQELGEIEKPRTDRLIGFIFSIILSLHLFTEIAKHDKGW